MVVLLLFAIMAFVKHETSGVGADFSWAWFSPRRDRPVGVHRRAVRLDLRLLGLGHRTDRQRGVQGLRPRPRAWPRCSAWCPSWSTYLIVCIAMQMFAGLGDTGLGLRNEEVSDNVFGNLAEPVMGFPLSLTLYLAVLASSAASLITTFLPTTRTLLAMAAYDAMPKRFAHIHPRFKSPSTATIAGRHRRGRLLHGDDDPQRAGADRHHPVARHHDLLLLRPGRVRLHLVLPQDPVRHRASTSSSSSCSRCSAVSVCSSC